MRWLRHFCNAAKTDTAIAFGEVKGKVAIAITVSHVLSAIAYQLLVFAIAINFSKLNNQADLLCLDRVSITCLCDRYYRES
jgi:hypothetical protein